MLECGVIMREANYGKWAVTQKSDIAPWEPFLPI
jgi:hypothetical protein